MKKILRENFDPNFLEKYVLGAVEAELGFKLKSLKPSLDKNYKKLLKIENAEAVKILNSFDDVMGEIDSIKKTFGAQEAMHIAGLSATKECEDRITRLQRELNVYVDKSIDEIDNSYKERMTRLEIRLATLEGKDDTK